MTKQLFDLYTSPISANGRKVLALTYHLQLNAQIHTINVYNGEGQTPLYLAINPFGKIPTLVDGDFILWESNAILQYIAENFGGEHLYSAQPKIRADISRWLFWESSTWQPAISTVLSSTVGHELVPQYVPAPTSDPYWKEPSFEKCIQFLNLHFRDNTFLVNNTLSIADISVAGMMTYFRFANFPFDQYQNLANWYTQIELLDAWQKTNVSPWG